MADSMDGRVGSEDAEDLYYLVRKGTNIRAIQYDDTPVVVEQDQVDDALAFYRPRVKPDSTPLVPMSINEYHERYHQPRARVKARIKATAQTEP